VVTHTFKRVWKLVMTVTWSRLMLVLTTAQLPLAVMVSSAKTCKKTSQVLRRVTMPIIMMATLVITIAG
jgi:hypothetical protein